MKSNPKEGKGSARVFGKFDIQELRNIRIAIRRPNIPDSGNSGPLQRSLDDPFNLIVHKIGNLKYKIIQLCTNKFFNVP